MLVAGGWPGDSLLTCDTCGLSECTGLPDMGVSRDAKLKYSGPKESPLVYFKLAANSTDHARTSVDAVDGAGGLEVGCHVSTSTPAAAVSADTPAGGAGGGLRSNGLARALSGAIPRTAIRKGSGSGDYASDVEVRPGTKHGGAGRASPQARSPGLAARASAVLTDDEIDGNDFDLWAPVGPTQSGPQPEPRGVVSDSGSASGDVSSSRPSSPTSAEGYPTWAPCSNPYGIPSNVSSSVGSSSDHR